MILFYDNSKGKFFMGPSKYYTKRVSDEKALDFIYDACFRRKQMSHGKYRYLSHQYVEVKADKRYNIYPEIA